MGIALFVSIIEMSQMCLYVCMFEDLECDACMVCVLSSLSVASRNNDYMQDFKSAQDTMRFDCTKFQAYFPLIFHLFFSFSFSSLVHCSRFA